MIRFDLPGDEALMLKSTAERFVEDHYGLARRAAMVAAPAGERPAHWRLMAELGWLVAPLPERAGGLAMAPVDLLPMLSALGAGLVLEPSARPSCIAPRRWPGFCPRPRPCWRRCLRARG